MKKILSVLLAAFIVLSAGGCSSKRETSESLSEEGIAPYSLTAREEYLLQSFGLVNNSQIIEFNAPAEAVSLKVNVYRLGSDGKWEDTGGGGISIGAEREPVESVQGIFTMTLEDAHSISYIINASGGLVSYKTEEIILETETVASANRFLEDFREIELNNEIPVALMVSDSGTSMRSYSLQDFFEPSKFEGMDLVQAMTFVFSDK